MTYSDLFQYFSLSEAAAQLDIHPFDIARYLSLQKGGLPVELRLTPQMISQVAEGMGLQNWWSEPMTIEDENPKKLLIRELSKRILEADWSNATRADNLNRGLAGQEYAFVRRVINAFIKCQLLTPNSTLTGLSIQKGAHPNWDRVLSTMVDGSSFPEEITILFS
jgi:hypothetical protein